MPNFNWMKVAGLFGPDRTNASTPGSGPDFPESAGDRERAKFRPSQYPRLDQIAVSDDTGDRIGTGSEGLLTRLDWRLSGIEQELLLLRNSTLKTATTITSIVGAPVYVTRQVMVPYGATSGALDANDAFGDEVFWDVPNRGRILSIRVVDPDDVVAAGTLSIYISTRKFTPAASDAAFTISANDALYGLTPQAFGPITDVGSARILSIIDVDEDYETSEGKLWWQLYTSGTPTPTATGMPRVQAFILPYS